MLALVAGAAACDTASPGVLPSPGSAPAPGAEPAPWDVRTGVEQVTVTGAEPGQPLTLYGSGNRRLLTLRADDAGQAHFAYLPSEHMTLESGPDLDYGQLDTPSGTSVAPGRYLVVDDSAEPRLASDVVRVPGRDDVPGTDLYDGQELVGARLDLLGTPAPGTAPEDGFQYLEMRDGVRLSAMVRFPDQGVYGPGPTRRSSSTPATRRPTPTPRSRAPGWPGPSATPPCRSTCGAPGARVGCSTSSAPPRWPTATT